MGSMDNVFNFMELLFLLISTSVSIINFSEHDSVAWSESLWFVNQTCVGFADLGFRTTF
jgi:hypothetical protein